MRNSALDERSLGEMRRRVDAGMLFTAFRGCSLYWLVHLMFCAQNGVIVLGIQSTMHSCGQECTVLSHRTSAGVQKRRQSTPNPVEEFGKYAGQRNKLGGVERAILIES